MLVSAILATVTSCKSSASAAIRELLTRAMLTTAGLAPHDLIRDLSRRMRCRECDEKDGVDISASTDQSRDQLTTLSHQFEQLAECEDILNTRAKFQTDPLPPREARTAADVDRRPYPSAALPEMGST